MLQIEKARLSTVQEKILKGENVKDLRGKHMNHKVKLTDGVKELIRQNCLSIHHQESHYSRESSSLFYFVNPELNLTSLYYQFLNY